MNTIKVVAIMTLLALLLVPTVALACPHPKPLPAGYHRAGFMDSLYGTNQGPKLLAGGWEWVPN
jgi:hypothetical protein